MGDIISHERTLQRSPPQEPEDLLVKVKECRILARRIKEITINLPSRFVLEDVAPSSMYVTFLQLDGTDGTGYSQDGKVKCNIKSTSFRRSQGILD